MTCIKLLNDLNNDLHIPAAPAIRYELLTICGWTDMNKFEEVEADKATCLDCLVALYQYKAMTPEGYK